MPVSDSLFYWVEKGSTPVGLHTIMSINIWAETTIYFVVKVPLNHMMRLRFLILKKCIFSHIHTYTYTDIHMSDIQIYIHIHIRTY